MSRYSFIILIGFALFFTACESEEADDMRSPDDLYASYFLFYNVKENTTQAYVAFCTGGECAGNEVELSQNESITFNGEPLLYENNEYVKKLDGLVNTGTFVWKTADGRTFTNQVQLEPIAFLPDLDTINRSENLELSWNGKPVQSAEVIFLSFPYILNNDGFTATINTEGAQKLMVPSSELNKVQKPGKREMILERQKFSHVQQGGAIGGIIGAIYRDYKEVTFQ